jgi:ribosome-associated toxin RatA of RatAB toxin-antitoxin module
MAAPAPPPSVKPRRRRTRLLFVPVMLLAIVVLAFFIFYVRGTWASTDPHNPTSVQEGPISELYQTPDGNKVVRCAILLPYPTDRVWNIVTDYPHYSAFLPYLSDIETTRTDSGCVMKGQAASAISGTWPFEITVHENKEAHRVSWDEKPSQGDVELNRGSWELTPVGENQTLLVLTLQAEVRSSPTFFLRNFFLHRLKQVVRAVDKRLQSEGP